jgi:hypothetical protein
VIVTVVVLLVALVASGARDESSRRVVLAALAWTDSFVRSPGLGGCAAAGAAMVALAQWRRQTRDESRRRQEQRRGDLVARRDQQWWDAYRLARADRWAHPEPLRDGEKLLLQVLAAQAETVIQTAAARSLLDPLAPDSATSDDDEEHRHDRRAPA